MKTIVAVILFAAMIAVANCACGTIYESNTTCSGEAEKNCVDVGKCDNGIGVVSCTATSITFESYANEDCDDAVEGNATFAIETCVTFVDGNKAIFTCASAALLPSLVSVLLLFAANAF
eukprot:m.11544 g.11544  ORF g.11544 m.11544 type:complete len:119 (+) comp9841_c0_seq1:70-426(+)